MLATIAFALAASITSGEPGTSPGERPPRAISTEPNPRYPTDAAIRGAEGSVEYVASVRSDGSVAEVRVISVPVEGVGFEDSIRDAVLRWRFEPGLRDGVPVASEYRGSFRFRLETRWSRGRIFSKSSRQVWDALIATLTQAQLRAKRIDDRNGVLITADVRFPKSMPTPDSAEGFSPRSIQFHLFVPPGIEPGRLYVASLLTVRSTLRGDRIVANDSALARWLLDAVSSTLGEEGRHIPYVAVERNAVFRAASSVENPCLTQKPAPVPALPSPDAVLPSLILSSRIIPVYPEKDRRARREGTIFVNAIVSEDGVVIGASATSPRPETELDEAAAMYVSLWRYRPGRVRGCPMSVPYTIRVDFRQSGGRF